MTDSDTLTREISAWAQMLQEAYDEWPEAAPEGDAIDSLGDVGRDIAIAAGQLFRYTANPEIVGHFQELPGASRRALALAACQGMSGDGLLEQVNHLAKEDEADEDALTELEDLLLSRDQWGLAADFIERITHDLRMNTSEPDFTLIAAVAQLRALLDTLDEAFYRMRPQTLLAMSIFDAIRAYSRVRPAEDHWWLADGEAVLRDEDRSFLTALAAIAPRQAAKPAGDIIDWIERKLQQAPQSPAFLLAAASDGPPRVELPLRGTNPRAYLSITLLAHTYHLEVRDLSGKTPPWAPDSHVQLFGTAGLLREWVLDCHGATRIPEFPRDGERHLRIFHSNEVYIDIPIDD